MICPNCTYETGYDEHYTKVDGKHGDFWHMELKMRRSVETDYYDDGKREAYMVGCPKCKQCFIHEL